MSLYRNALPQLSGHLFLADAGIETDLIFNRGVEIPEFAAHTLLSSPEGREAMREYFRPFLELARDLDAGFILDSQTWKAHMHWAEDLGESEERLRAANRESLEFISLLRAEFASNAQPIVLNAIVGPRGDAYGAGTDAAVEDAERYYSHQLAWLAETEADMVTATTFPSAGEATGVVRAARELGLPVVVSFTVETDGRLPSGQSLREAIAFVDSATDSAAAYFLLNCAHPDHFRHVLANDEWAHRLRGVRCNASRKSHAELDQSDVLDAGDPVELGQLCRAIQDKMSWFNIFGGCCGSDLRHVTEIAHAVC